MSHIFVSYAQTDLQRVRPLVQALKEHGWSVWWDQTMLAGGVIAHAVSAAVDGAGCIIVVWTSESVGREWVLSEAEEGRQRDILVPVRLDAGARPPLQFRNRATLELADWKGAKDHPEFVRLVEAVTAKLGPPPSPEPRPPDVVRPAPAPPQESRPPVVERPVIPPPQERTQDPERYVNSLGVEFVWIPVGEFLMGSTDGEADERLVHRVRISRPFYLGKYAVTQGEWESVMGTNPSKFTGDPRRPVEQVSWEDAQEFIGKVNAKEGGTKYRLPTEAEWEYAARAGSMAAYSFGDDVTQLGEYAWYDQNAGNTTHPVGQRTPNAWGLYDMHGNVWEWVQDWYGAYAAETAVDPQGPSSGSARVLRGGSWLRNAGLCRVASRGSAPPGGRGDSLGLRLLRTAP